MTDPGPPVDGRFELEELLGKGAFGAAWKARDRDGTAVVVKLLHARLSAATDVVERFRREVRALERIDHPGSVRLVAAGVCPERQQPYYATEWVEGETLRDVLVRDGRLPLERALRIAEQIADLLVAAHAAGILHRDLKPANVIVEGAGGPRERARVIDFGLAKLAAGGERTMAELTGQAAIGTPRYMSPEQCVGEPVGAGTDVYALGCVLMECLSGAAPFERKSVRGFVMAHLREPPPPLAERWPEAPEELTRLVDRCLAKDPRERPSAAEVRDALRALQPEPELERATAAERSLQGAVTTGRLSHDSTDGTARDVAAGAGLLGERVGRHVLRERLGLAGFGMVYRASDALIGGEGALVLLDPEAAPDEAAGRRLVDALAGLARFRHPLFLVPLDVGRDRATGRVFYLTERVAAASLAEVLDTLGGRLGLRRTLRLGAELLEGLSVAHRAGLVHGDLRPDDVLVDHDATGGEIYRVLELGLAAAVGQALGDASPPEETWSSHRYLAPELRGGARLRPDVRADVYGVAAVLFACLTGRAPREVGDPAVALDVPEVPGPVRGALARALAADPAARFADVLAFRMALLAAPGGEADSDALPSLLGSPLPAGPAGLEGAAPTIRPEALAARGAAPGPPAPKEPPPEERTAAPPPAPGGGRLVAGGLLVLALLGVAVGAGYAVHAAGLLASGSPSPEPTTPSPEPTSPSPEPTSPTPGPSGASPPPDGGEPSPPPTPDATASPGRLVLTRPRAGARHGRGPLEVAGRLEPAAGGEVRIGDARGPIAPDGTFVLGVDPPGEGPVRLEVVARPGEGEPVRADLRVVVDRTPPRLTVERPGPGAAVAGDTVEVAGRVADDGAVTVTVDGEPVELRVDGAFRAVVRLPAPGERVVRVEAVDDVGNAALVVERRVVRKPAEVRLEIESPAAGAWTAERELAVAGRVAASPPVASVDVLFAGRERTCDVVDGRFATRFRRFEEGEHALEVQARGGPPVTRGVHVDRTPPRLRPEPGGLPRDGLVTRDEVVEVAVRIDPSEAAPVCRVTAGGQEREAAPGEVARFRIPLEVGTNRIEVRAVDLAGNGSPRIRRAVVRAAPLPEAIARLRLDGIFARFETSFGELVARLDYRRCPLTVANFIGLAEGRTAWRHPETGDRIEGVPFYDGLTFHEKEGDDRLVGGCPEGDGTGNPGYVFADEVVPGFEHDDVGLLGMERAPDFPGMNGSQFYLTTSLSGNDHLDGRRTVFGTVVSGEGRLTRVAREVGVGQGGRPARRLTIHRIRVFRVGEEALRWRPKEIPGLGR